MCSCYIVDKGVAHHVTMVTGWMVVSSMRPHLLLPKLVCPMLMRSIISRLRRWIGCPYGLLSDGATTQAVWLATIGVSNMMLVLTCRKWLGEGGGGGLRRGVMVGGQVDPAT